MGRFRRKSVWLAALGVLLALVPTGCPSPNGGTTTPTVNNGTGGVVEQHNDLFVPQPGQGYSFSTNDSAYWGPNGYTLWTLPLAGQSTFVQRDVIVVKKSGNAYAGYGIVFCHDDPGISSSGETMLLVMINTQRQYSVGSVAGADYTPYTNPTWIQELHLNGGYGVANEVKITRSGGGLFTLFLNSTQVMTFRDGRIPTPTGGGDGFLAVISPQDSFPQAPVSVSYTEN